MKAKSNYLSLLILLPFIVGQVQYAYTSYFCEMTGKIACPPCAPSSMAGSNDCDECTSVALPDYVGESFNSDCMQLNIEQKSVVDNFTSSQKVIHHFVVVSAVGLQATAASGQSQGFSEIVFIPTDSPPPDLPTLNSSLRI